MAISYDPARANLLHHLRTPRAGFSLFRRSPTRQRRTSYLRGLMSGLNQESPLVVRDPAFWAGRRRGAEHFQKVDLPKFQQIIGATHNVGSFKTRRGQWRKGQGGRFVGAA